ncbi:MAG: helix-turn-helix transcriptional regulator [Fibrobacteres bacterium]|nr:helix-turn-helix transcriptional regulator [Fibrobacterota bacterium]
MTLEPKLSGFQYNNKKHTDLQLQECWMEAWSVHKVRIPKVFTLDKDLTNFLVMMMKTPGKLGTLNEINDVPAYSLIIWEPAVERVFGNDNGPFIHSWFYCLGSSIEKLFKSSPVPKNKPMQISNHELFDKYILRLHDEVTAHEVPSDRIILNLLDSLLVEVDREISVSNKLQHIPSNILELKSYLEANFNKPITLDDLSKKANLSKNHFCAIYKKYLKISPIEYLIDLRIEYAKELLKNIDLTMAQISQTVGYEDEFYFSRIFKKRQGISPAKYRNLSPNLNIPVT